MIFIYVAVAYWIFATVVWWIVATYHANKGWETTKPTLFSVIGGQINWIMNVPRFLKTLRIW